MQRRPVDELVVAEADSGLSIVEEICNKALVPVEILTRSNEEAGRKALEAIQVHSGEILLPIRYVNSKFSGLFLFM